MMLLKPINNALLGAGLFSFCALAGAAPRASVVGVESPGGDAYATSINASGQTAGYVYDYNTRSTFAFLSAGGTLQNLGSLGASSSYSAAHGVNALGQVAGDFYLTADQQHAFVYANGAMRDLGTLGGTQSAASGINDAGQVVGSSTTSTGNYQAFVYANGSMQALGVLASGGHSFATGINNSGQVTGFATVADGNFHAFRYAGGTMQDLGTLGGAWSAGHAINASGQVVGDASTVGNSAFHAFVYTDGVMQELGTLGGANSTAQGINASGQVVGRAETNGSSMSPTLWNGGVAYDLSTWVPAGAFLVDATSINDLAQVAVTGYLNGTWRAMVLTLHPDWQGGNGNWSDASHWNFAGMGNFGINPGAPHDVVINPTGSATVWGPMDAAIKSLAVSGAGSNLVTLNLNSGNIYAQNGTTLGANGTVAGNGRLAGDLARLLPSHAERDLEAHTARQGDFVFATSTVAEQEE